MNKHIVEYIQLSLGDKCPVLKGSQSMISPPEKSASQWQSHASRRHPISLCSRQPPIVKVEGWQQSLSSKSRNTLKVLQSLHTPIYLHPSIPPCTCGFPKPSQSSGFVLEKGTLQVQLTLTGKCEVHLICSRCQLPFIVSSQVHMSFRLLCVWRVIDALWDDQIQL